jgi:SAM-dependent methyltransferase
MRAPAYKQRVIRLLRSTGLLPMMESLRLRLVMRGSNRNQFLREHGEVPLPPDEISYDAYGNLNWHAYWTSGRDGAAFVAGIIHQHFRTGRVLEWGCGPGRVIRHLPPLLPGCEIFGTDYNGESIDWCAANLQGIKFTRNGTAPPQPFPDAHFDCIYCLSVFTHLSEELHYLWASELVRLLKPGGILICTFHGSSTREWLLPEEKARFDSGRLVIRDGVGVGTRCFLAYQPESFVRNSLLRGLEVLDHKAGNTQPFGYQDVWVARKPLVTG